MEEYESALDEYLSLGYPISVITQCIRREITKNKLPTEIKGIIKSYAPPKKPPFPESDVEDELDEIRQHEGKEAASAMAKRVIFWYPTNRIARFIIYEEYLPVSEVIPSLLRRDVKLSNVDAGELWLLMMLKHQYPWARKLYERYPTMYLSTYTDEPLYEDVTDQEIEEYSKYPEVMANDLITWENLYKYEESWRDNMSFRLALEKARKIRDERLKEKYPLLLQRSRSRSPTRSPRRVYVQFTPSTMTTTSPTSPRARSPVSPRRTYSPTSDEEENLGTEFFSL